ncbi:beta-lactamase hydrolase domain-containing protein [Sphingomonas psychrotolerans]|uniref:TIGR01244 family phosphatase n=1 Tax=Sphingomonas psychrotolerans TaxID=1327635 RepID=A0A2K8MH84_9SPHN|nr:sulfur transferase domain-containing protein [Sphingomonas psychrotolerans]ATY31109.1 TIGR01244 family phosphatase [Sphingomonas psychrotolerans]
MEGRAAAGVKGINNNRPDGEATDQPMSLELEAEARRHGLAYWHIPDHAGQATAEDAKAIEAANGPVLALYRTGVRSTGLCNMCLTSSLARSSSQLAWLKTMDLCPLRDQRAGRDVAAYGGDQELPCTI